MVRAFIIMLLFKKPFLRHSPLAIENEKHAALKTNKPLNSGNKYMGCGGRERAVMASAWGIQAVGGEMVTLGALQGLLQWEFNILYTKYTKNMMFF